MNKISQVFDICWGVQGKAFKLFYLENCGTVGIL